MIRVDAEHVLLATGELLPLPLPADPEGAAS